MTAAVSASLASFLTDVRERVDGELGRILGEASGGATGADDPGRLREAMRYAVLGGGKRLRPALTLAAAATVDARGVSSELALSAACAVELLHAYTLVHDDLPAMDDDDLRRGRPTVHVAFGEANAILVGDALLTEAFGTLAALGPRAGDAVRVLANRAGARELLAGQARDLAGEHLGEGATVEGLEQLHAEKTGALFAAAAELGAIAAGADAETRARLARYGLTLGIAFQHADDIADGDQPALANESRRRLAQLVAAAIDEARALGDRGGRLVELAEWVGALA